MLFGTQRRPRRLKFYCKQEASEGHVARGLVLGRSHRVLLSYTDTSKSRGWGYRKEVLEVVGVLPWH